jgi:hypothetical protein
MNKLGKGLDPALVAAIQKETERQLEAGNVFARIGKMALQQKKIEELYKQISKETALYEDHDSESENEESDSDSEDGSDNEFDLPENSEGGFSYEEGQSTKQYEASMRQSEQVAGEILTVEKKAKRDLGEFVGVLNVKAEED